MSAEADEFGIEEWAAEDIRSKHKRDWPAWAPVWEALIFSDLSDRAVRLYAALARYSGENGAWPSRRTLATRLNRSVDSIDRAKDELLSAGWMSAEHRYRDGERITNLYRLHQSADSRPPGRTDAPTPGRTDAAQNDNHLERHPPTPQSAAAGSDQPTRTYPSGPVRTAEDLADLDGRSQPRVPLEKITALKEQLRPPREPAVEENCG